VYHVRLTGSLQKRIERVQKLRNLTAAAAAKMVRKEDYDRRKYVKAHFHARLDNELLYDLVINTDHVSEGDVVAVIVEGARRFFSVL
jgi:cytidylate kinase